MSFALIYICAVTDYLPAHNLLKGDNVVKVFMRKKRETFQLLSYCIESIAHPHCVHSCLEERIVFKSVLIYHIFPITDLIFPCSKVIPIPSDGGVLDSQLTPHSTPEHHPGPPQAGEGCVVTVLIKRGKEMTRWCL